MILLGDKACSYHQSKHTRYVREISMVKCVEMSKREGETLEISFVKMEKK